MAEQEGEFVPSVKYKPSQKDIFEVALHNAVEGCVHETWSALIANWQSAHLEEDPDLCIIYHKIGQDETNHGQLAWDLHHWFLSQLTKNQQKTIKKSQQQAIARLLINNGNMEYIAGLGLPTTQQAQMLTSIFCAELVA